MPSVLHPRPTWEGRPGPDRRGDEAEHSERNDLVWGQSPARMPQKAELDCHPESIRAGPSRRHEFKIRRGQRVQLLEFLKRRGKRQQLDALRRRQ